MTTGVSTARRALVSLAIGVLISCAFWFVRDLGAEGYNAMVNANLAAIAVGSVVSDNVHQPSTIAMLVTMVIQWTLVTFAALWIIARLRRK